MAGDGLSTLLTSSLRHSALAVFAGQDGELRLRTVYRLEGAAPSLVRDLTKARCVSAPAIARTSHTPHTPSVRQTCLQNMGRAWPPLANAVHDLSALVERQPPDAAAVALEPSALQSFLATAVGGQTQEAARRP